MLIRDGSACKDVATLALLLSLSTSPFIAFCTDDRNPLDMLRKAVSITSSAPRSPLAR